MIERYRTMIESDGGSIHRLEDWGRAPTHLPDPQGPQGALCPHERRMHQFRTRRIDERLQVQRCGHPQPRRSTQLGRDRSVAAGEVEGRSRRRSRGPRRASRAEGRSAIHGNRTRDGLPPRMESGPQRLPANSPRRRTKTNPPRQRGPARGIGRRTARADGRRPIRRVRRGPARGIGRRTARAARRRPNPKLRARTSPRYRPANSPCRPTKANPKLRARTNPRPRTMIGPRRRAKASPNRPAATRPPRRAMTSPRHRARTGPSRPTAIRPPRRTRRMAPRRRRSRDRAEGMIERCAPARARFQHSTGEW